MDNATIRLTPKHVLIEGPGKGILQNEFLDNRLIPDQAWADARNMRFYAGGRKARKSDSFTQYDTTTGSVNIRQLMRYVDLAGVSQLVRVSNTGALKGFAPATAITGVLTGTANNPVTWDQYQDLLVWTDQVDNPKKWDGVSAGFSDLGGAPVKAKIVRVFKGSVHFFNLLNQPWRGAYSAIDTPEIFIGATAGDNDFLETPGAITAAEVLDDVMVVFKKNAIHLMRFEGLPDNYTQGPTSADDGTPAARTVVKVGSYLYYVGERNFYRFQTYPEPIGTPIFPLFKLLADYQKSSLWYAYTRPQFNEICWKVTSSGSAAPDLTFVYNYVDGTWGVTDYDPGTSYIKIRLTTSNDTWDAGPADTWDAGASVSWDDPGLSLGADFELFSRTDGTIQQYLGHGVASTGAFRAYLESKVHNLDSITPARLTRVPLIAGGTGAVDVQIRSWDDERQTPPTFASVGTYPLSTMARTPWVDCRRWGRLQQIRFQNNDPTDDYAIEMYGLEFVPGQGHR